MFRKALLTGDLSAGWVEEESGNQLESNSFIDLRWGARLGEEPRGFGTLENVVHYLFLSEGFVLNSVCCMLSPACPAADNSGLFAPPRFSRPLRFFVTTAVISDQPHLIVLHDSPVQRL